MRKLSVAIAVFALLAAACGGGDGDSTTTVGSTGNTQEPGETTTTEAEPSTTEPGPTTTLGEGTLFYECSPSSGSGLSQGVMCADYSAGITSPLVNDEVEVLNFRGSGPLLTAAIQVNGQSCMPSDEVLVFPDIPDGAAPGPLTKVDFSGLENGEAFQTYLDAIQLGVYNLNGADLFPIIEQIELANDSVASPHYLLGPTQTWKYGPAGQAEPVAGRWDELPDDKNPDDPSDGRVIVVDTGGWEDDPNDDVLDIGVAKAEAEAPNVHPDIAGHGQFAASIVKRYNPDLTVEIFSASGNGTFGQMSELSVVDAIGRVEAIDGSVVNLSLGTYPCSSDDPPLGLALGLSFLPQELTIDGNGVVTDTSVANVRFVAASGNDGPGEPAMYPARLSSSSVEDILGFGEVELGELATLIDALGGPGSIQASVFAVGAVDIEGNEAEFSNPADYYVPGVDVVGWHQPSDSLAVWSGTSFAAPRFAACLASGVCGP